MRVLNASGQTGDFRGRRINLDAPALTVPTSIPILDLWEASLSVVATLVAASHSPVILRVRVTNLTGFA